MDLKILVISDTHVPTVARELPSKILDEGRHCDMILHAGDLVSNQVAKQLSLIAPFHAVRGNMDAPDLIATLPSRQIVEVGRWRIGLAHGHEGRGVDTPHRALSVFSSDHPDCVVFGHSHKPLNELMDDVLLFNPGSPVAGRGESGNTYGIFDVGEKIVGSIVRL